MRGRLGNLSIPLFSTEEKTKCNKKENFEKPSSEKQSREDSIEYLNICNKGIILYIKYGFFSSLETANYVKIESQDSKDT